MKTLPQSAHNSLAWTCQDLNTGSGKKLGDLWCADGDGMWTILIVRPGEEHRFEMHGDLCLTDYGSGWEAVGGASQLGAYVFDQGRLHTMLLSTDTMPVTEPAFLRHAIRLGEYLMSTHDPDLYAYLGGVAADVMRCLDRADEGRPTRG